MATSNPTTNDGGADARITTRMEPPSEGGEIYARCTGCGRESIHGEAQIVHRDDCALSED